MLTHIDPITVTTFDNTTWSIIIGIAIFVSIIAMFVAGEPRKPPDIPSEKLPGE